MARKKRKISHRRETLPILRPDLGFLPLWCTYLFALFLHTLAELSYFRAKYALVKARQATFANLLKKSADFLQTTSGNSNWPSSVTSSPIMMRGRRLLESIHSALGTCREERPVTSIKKKEGNSSEASPPGK